jgi:tRNA A-37 threonylcarbamoyl transferase component Bud32
VGTVSVSSPSADTSLSETKTEKLQPPAELPPSLARFEILEVLGAGAFGTVYKARDPKLDRDVAIKVPKESMLKTKGDHERFLREARAAANLSHPNICPVHEVAESEGRDYIVMGFIQGKPLSALIATGRIQARQAAFCTYKLSKAFQEAHENGILHRDIKPANIMINRKGEPIVMDFGLARLQRPGDAQITQHGQIMGSPAYMSPEQAKGATAEISPASDIYSLGVVLYEMLCGKRPFAGSVTEVLGQILHVPAPLPSTQKPGIDPALESLCMKAMAKDPKDRFPSMKAFAEALADYLKRSPDGTVRAGSSVTVESDVGEESKMTEMLAQLAAEQRSLTRHAVREAVEAGAKAARLTWPMILGAAGVLGVIVFLGIWFFARAGTVSVLIQIPIDITDPALTFVLDDKAIDAESLAAPIELKPGVHRLIVNRDGKLFKEFRFRVGKEKEKIAVEDVTPPPEIPKEEIGPTTEDYAKYASGPWTPLWDSEDAVKASVLPKTPAEDVTWKNGVIHMRNTGGLIGPGPVRNLVVRMKLKHLFGKGQFLSFRHGLDPVAGEITEDLPRYTNWINGYKALGLTGQYEGKVKGLGGNTKREDLKNNQFYEWMGVADGDYVAIYINGEMMLKLKDDAIPEGYFLLVVSDGEAVAKDVEYRILDPKAKTDAANGGWTSLLSGNTLEGWQGRPDVWSVRDGILAGQPKKADANTFLFSPRDYADFELRFQARVGGDGNSGVQIRSGILDANSWTARGPQADLGNRPGDLWGGVYAEELPGGWLLKPSSAPTVEPNGWNDIFIRSVGQRVTIQVNGATTVDGDIPQMQKTGRIAFQVHRQNQDLVEFREIKIRGLGIPADGPDHAAGFVPLFNGIDLTGWKTHAKQPGGWTVEDGLLTGRGNTAHHLFSERGDFSDLHLRAEVRISDLGNSGIYVRGAFDIGGKGTFGDCPNGYEAQIQNQKAHPNNALTGSLWAGNKRIHTFSESLVKAEEWFVLEFIARGPLLVVKVNGRETANLEHAEFQKGHIVLQSRSDDPARINTVVQFRKIEVKELKE